jgi:hypothetical protein
MDATQAVTNLSILSYSLYLIIPFRDPYLSLKNSHPEGMGRRPSPYDDTRLPQDTKPIYINLSKHILCGDKTFDIGKKLCYGDAP